MDRRHGRNFQGNHKKVMTHTPRPRHHLTSAPVAARVAVAVHAPVRTGDTGNDVKVLQQCLNAQGFIIASSGTGSSGKETTFFGSLTAAALKELQNTHATEILIPVGIPAGGGTGIFGASTRMYMNTLGCKGGGLTDKPFSRVLLVGSSGEDVMLLQLYLAQNKIIYPEGTVSGYYGNLTRQAVIRFQKKNKLSETGIVDAETQNSIHSFYNVIP